MALLATATPNASAISSLLARAVSCPTIEPSQPAKSAAVLFRPGVRGFSVRSVEHQVPGLPPLTNLL